MVVWLGFVWYGRRPRELDLWRLHAEVCYPALEPEKIKAALYEQSKVETPIPLGFNYACLKFSGVVPCQGRSVPMLLFIRGESEARVYVIASDQFDLKTLNEAEPIDSGGYEVKIVPEDSDHSFVVIHKGELQPLLAHENAAQ